MHFDPQVYALLERGWLVAFAHCRGGGELGAAWHQAGKGPRKWNTYKDFAACARLLSDRDPHRGLGVTSPGLMCASGGSAGGLVMGVMANEYPQLFAALLMRWVAHVVGGSVVGCVSASVCT